MTRGSIVLVAIAAAGLLTALLFAVGASGAPRVIVAILFLLIGPGLACVRVLRLDDPLLEVTLAVTLSLGLETIVATVLLAMGSWSPGRALAMVVAMTLVAVAAGLTRARGQPSPGRDERAVGMVVVAEQGARRAER